MAASAEAEPTDMGEALLNEWRNRVFKVVGSRMQGSGVLIDEKHILTVAHLGFRLNESYKVSNHTGQFDVKCIYISKAADFAVLNSTDLPSIKFACGGLDRGRKFWIFGFPRSSSHKFPSISEGIVENVHENMRHFIGVPGARRGFSGGPVINILSTLCGLLVGGVHGISADTTVKELMESYPEQRTALILPFTTIKAIFQAVPTDNES